MEEEKEQPPKKEENHNEECRDCGGYYHELCMTPGLCPFRNLADEETG